MMCCDLLVFMIAKTLLVVVVDVLCYANDIEDPVETAVADFEVRTQTSHTPASDLAPWQEELRANHNVETTQCRPNCWCLRTHRRRICWIIRYAIASERNIMSARTQADLG
jgi:hypothetical protein